MTMLFAVQVSRGKIRCAYMASVKKTLGRPRLRQDDNIKMGLKIVKAADCIHLAQHRDQRSNIMFHKTQTIS
jgi:hypothetical protein